MISAYRASQNNQPRNYSHSAYSYAADYTFQAYARSAAQCEFQSKTVHTPSSPTRTMSRSTEVVGIKDFLDEHGYFNSSHQLVK